MFSNFRLLNAYLICFGLFHSAMVLSRRKYSKRDVLKLREEVREMFDHAYTGYLKYAYPYDELRPLTCDGIDTWGSYSLTLIDALDTLAVMGNYSEFRRVVGIVTSNANFDANINVSVFETNIRIVGGLLSAHLFSQRAGLDLEPGWPCNGPLLRLAEDVARRLLPAFDTKSGMPYGTVNLRYGVPIGETSVTCTAGVGTFILEFSALSRLTGDPIYEEVAMHALRVLFDHRSSIGLYGNHIDIKSGKWVARDSGIGAGVDSYFEYLVKGSILLNRPELMAMFNEAREPIDKYLKKNNWYIWASMAKGQVTLPVFQSLEAYWPGVLTLIGDVDSALRSMHNYNSVWKQYGFTPEFYNIPQGQAGTNRESYPLRPELVESAMYLYRATGDPFMLDIGKNILRSIQYSAKTRCGYATIKDARDHSLENRMESFFLAETTKYLYLLFDPDNFIHNRGSHGRLHTLSSGKQCVLDSGAYIFNTEAHPIDASALHCCHDWKQERYNPYSSFDYKGNIVGVTENNTVDSNDEKLQDQIEEDATETNGDEEVIVNMPSVQLRRKGLESVNDVETSNAVPIPGKEDEELDVTEGEVNALDDSHPKVTTPDDKMDALSEEWLQREKDGQFVNITEHTEHRKKLIKIIKNNHRQLTNADDSESLGQIDTIQLLDRRRNAIEKAGEPTFTPDDEPKIDNISLDRIASEDTVVAGTTKNVVGENFLDLKDEKIDLMTLTDYVRTLVVSPTVPKNKFNVQALLETVRQASAIRRSNPSLNNKFDYLTCKAQPFLIRITIAGEFLDEK